MKIGIIADTHDDVGNLKVALEALRAENVAAVLHCGDVCESHVIHILADFDVWIAQGNMDRDFELAQAAEEQLGPGRFAWLQCPALDGYRVAMLHGENEEVLGNLIASGEYTYVFHGHTHRRRDRTIGHTRVINPGALGGRRPERRSFCVLDLATGEAHFVELG
jgi:putative phosphoesterase